MLVGKIAMCKILSCIMPHHQATCLEKRCKQTTKKRRVRQTTADTKRREKPKPARMPKILTEILILRPR